MLSVSPVWKEARYVEIKVNRNGTGSTAAYGSFEIAYMGSN